MFGQVPARATRAPWSGKRYAVYPANPFIPGRLQHLRQAILADHYVAVLRCSIPRHGTDRDSKRFDSGSVYRHAHFSADRKSIQVAVPPRKGSAAVCSRCRFSTLASAPTEVFETESTHDFF